MRLLESGLAQAKAWYAAQALSSDSEAERKRAMQTLRELGAASLPSLHATIRRTGAPAPNSARQWCCTGSAIPWAWAFSWTA